MSHALHLVAPRVSVVPQVQWFRLGAGTIGLKSADRALTDRFEEIYGGCAVEAPTDGPVVICRVAESVDGVVRITFDDPSPLDVASFVNAVFPDRGYAAVAAADGAVIIGLPGSADVVRFDRDGFHAPARSAWQPLIANLAVSRLIRLQQDVTFFHAASMKVGAHGILACGPKRSGKTTLALALAARGHALLGDEMAAVHLASRSLLPVRRSLATREGPHSTRAAVLLAANAPKTERFPDGEFRQRHQVRDVSPLAPPLRTPLTTLLILRTMGPVTSIRRAEIGPALLSAVTPLAASLWDRPAGLMAVRLMRLLSTIRVFEVDAGPPDEFADRVEDLMEDG